MDVLLIGLGIWCGISVPTALVVAKLCGLNRARSEVVTAVEAATNPLPSIPQEQLSLS
jgi:hypothetical protein